MDFGAAVGADGLVGSDPDAKQKLYRSGFFKQLERPSSEDADEWRAIDDKGSAKVAKLGDDSFSVAASKAVALLPRRSSGNSLFSDAQQSQHMLCFSTSPSALHKSESQSEALPCLSYAPSVYSNYAGIDAAGRALKLEWIAFLKVRVDIGAVNGTLFVETKGRVLVVGSRNVFYCC